ncbi:MAG: hypothetical protein V1834_02625 [Candidatus Micrarchaeota archaeon]
MKKLITFLVIGLLLFGCSSAPGDNTGAQAQTGSPTQAGEQLNTQTQQQTLTGAITAEQFANLVASRQPFDCVVTSTTSAGQVLTIGIKGTSGKFRTESTADGTESIATIADGDSETAYTKLPKATMNGMNIPGCDWIKVEGKEEVDEAGFVGTYDKQYEDLQTPPAEATITCTTPNFDDSIFTPTGDICTMDEYMNKMYERQCEAIAPNDVQACVDAFNSGEAYSPDIPNIPSAP